MKVLQICAAYKPAYIYGGPTMSVSMLSEQLTRAGVETEVYATTANGNAELPVAPGRTVVVDGVKVTYFKRLTKDHSHYSPALIRKLWAEAGNFDVIHIHAWWNLVSVFACLAALMRRVPVLLSPRGTLSAYTFLNRNTGPKRLIHTIIGRRLLDRCRIHVTSTREHDAILELVQPKSITILPNFVRLPVKANHTEHQPEPVFRLLFLSRVEEKKGLDLLIEALAMVTVHFHLTIAGSGNEAYIETLKAMAVKTGVADKIRWAGFQDDGKFDLMRAHDLFVLPSHDENFGNAVIESLSTGTAVLISRHVGLADYVEEGRLGWICETSTASIGRLINEIAHNHRAELERIRMQAPDKIYDAFYADSLVKRYVNMYAQIVER